MPAFALFARLLWRPVRQGVKEQLGRLFMIENRPGDDPVIAIAAVAKAAADATRCVGIDDLARRPRQCVQGSALRSGERPHHGRNSSPPHPSVLIVSQPLYDLWATPARFSAAAGDDTYVVGGCDPDATFGGDRSFAH
jgi:hypothetical protein